MLATLLLSLSLLTMTQSMCHYSCATCAGPLYSMCLSCVSGNLSILEDPATLPPQYWSSIYSTGACVDTFYPNANALGIVLVLVCVAAVIALRTKQLFYLLMIYQTLGLLSLVEIAWVNSIGYLNTALQYFMIFNTMGQQYKQADGILTINKKYRLELFLRQVSLGQNLALLAPIILICLVLLIVLLVLSYCKRRQQYPEKDKEKSGPMELQSSNSDRKLVQPVQVTGGGKIEKVIKVCIIVQFLLVQETAVVLLASLVYNIDTPTIILSIVYLHILIFLISCSHYHSMELFGDRKSLYLSYAVKIVLPVMVVVPMPQNYLFFVFLAGFLIIRVFLDLLERLYEHFSRIIIYRLLELLVTLLVIIYFCVEYNQVSQSSSSSAAIAASFILSIMLICYLMEIPISIKEVFFQSNNETMDSSIRGARQEDTLQCIDQLENAEVSFDHEKHTPFQEQSQHEKRAENDEKANLQTLSVKVSEAKVSDNRVNKQDVESFNSKEQNTTQAKEQKTTQAKETIQIQPQDGNQPEIVIPIPKKKRKPVLDKELRLRYGI